MFILLYETLIIFATIIVILSLVAKLIFPFVDLYISHIEKRELIVKQNDDFKLIEQFHNKVEEQYQHKYNNLNKYRHDISYKILIQLYIEMSMCFSMKISQSSLCLSLNLYPNQYMQLDTIGNELLKEGLELIEQLDISTKESDDVNIQWCYNIYPNNLCH